jgi:hypothetical protein
MGTSTDTSGNYTIETYYATDSLQFVFLGYKTKTVAVKLDQSQEINISLKPDVEELETFFVRPPDELPSITLHKKIIANKRINNKEKLTSFDYEVYNKMQLDLNNIGEKFTERGLIQRLDVVMDYLDSTDDGSTYLPVLLSESISDFRFDEIFDFSEGKAKVIINNKVGFIDQTGQLVGDTLFNDAGTFNEGFAWVSKADKYYYVDTTGQIFSLSAFDDASDFETKTQDKIGKPA